MAAVADNRKLRYMHWLAVVATTATFLLLVAGGAVTSLDVGMADTVWPTPPWYLLVLFKSGRALERGIGFLVEHAHRQVGWIVGMIIVVMALASWSRALPRWMRWWCLTLLIIVSVQGVLGGLRVLDVSRELAVVHGVTAHLFFAACLLTAFLTRPGRHERLTQLEVDTVTLYQRTRTAVAAAGLLLFQIVTGAVLRHLGLWLGVHVLGAVAAALATMALGFGCFFMGDRPLFSVRSWVLMLGAFGQVLLGASAWVSANGFGPYAVGPITRTHAYAATAHMLLGSVLLATATTVLVDLYAALRAQWATADQSPGHEPVPTPRAVGNSV